MKRGLVILGFVFMFPQWAFACGGDSFDAPHWGMYVAAVLSVLHGAVFFLLKGKWDAAKKELLAKRYAEALLHTHVSLPLCIFTLYAAVAFACIDMRSDQEKFVDSLSIYIIGAWLASFMISLFLFLRNRSKFLTPERRVHLAANTALSLLSISVVTFGLLAYALLVIAPTISNSPALYFDAPRAFAPNPI